MISTKPCRVLVPTMPSPPNQVQRNIALRRQVSAAVAQLRIPFENDLSRTLTIAKNSLEARLTLIDERGELKSSQVVDITHFDERGITFHHELPLSDRRAMLLMESPQAGQLTAEVDLTWCRFNRTGRYTSGGRFVQLVGKTA